MDRKITDFPPEILEIIFKNLSSIEDLIACKKACVRFDFIIENMFQDNSKYLVVSDDGQEIVDLLNPSAKLEFLTNNISRIFGAAGSRLQEFPIVLSLANQ